MTKSKLWRKGLIWIIGYSPSSGDAKAGTQGGNLEAGIGAETMEDSCLLASPHGLLSLLSCIYLGLGLPPLITHQVSAPQAYRPVFWGHFLY